MILTVKRNTETLFLMELPVFSPVDDTIKKITEIHNMKLRLSRLIDAANELAQYGLLRPEKDQGYSIEELEEIKGGEELAKPTNSKAGQVFEKNGIKYVYNPDPTGRRNGEAPIANYVDAIKSTTDNAKKLVEKEFWMSSKFLTTELMQEAITLISGALTMAYPMGMSEGEPADDIIKDIEDLSGSAASKEVISLDDATLWWAGKEIMRGKNLSDFVGKNDKCKVIVKLQKKSQGAPVRESPMDEQAQREMMAFYYKKQEEHKKLLENNDDEYLNAPWANTKSLKEFMAHEEVGNEELEDSDEIQNEEKTGEVEDDEEKLVVDTEVLTAEMIGPHISLLARTGNGLSHAYTRLEIRSKNLTNIDILENYVHLRYIDLSENLITNISALASLEYLLSVDFHSNKIKKIPASLERRKYLQQANFAKNEIELIEVFNWPMLAWLNLNENKLKEIKLQEFEELIHLEARGNKIFTTKGINAKKLEKLYLGGNEITTLDFGEKPNLQFLHLRDNKIVTLDTFNDSFKSLTYVNLRNNLVESLDDIWSLGKLPNLKALNLIDNPVTKLANYRIETIYRCKLLEKLDKEPITDEEKEDAAAVSTFSNQPAK
ncbi:hypothetical protein HK100_010784 [Physocladia obscura]|uniref:Uncharacterized protein n=1 Tax=Physocladia obscura TaxID=109957 RepID=A0AAD5XHE7_9FUNG|nr:hypothetical protein HK100_010784 [Physocladia obscura]